jgi:hypothetical protein
VIIVLFFSSSAFSIANDFSPLAIGNWWKYKTITGKLLREVTGISGDSLILTTTYFDNKDSIIGKYTISVRSDESQGCYYGDLGNYQYFEGLLTYNIQGPHFAIPDGASFTTPLGTFTPVDSFDVFRHGQGWSKELFYSGIGSLGGIELTAFGNLKLYLQLIDYHCVMIPTAFFHEYQKSEQTIHFSSQWIGIDSAEISFNMPGTSCADFYSVSSYHQPTNCLRIYIADTNSQHCTDTVNYYHHLKIRIPDPNHECKIKILLKLVPAKTSKSIVVKEGVIPPKSSSYVFSQKKVIVNQNLIPSLFYDLRGKYIGKYFLNGNNRAQQIFLNKTDHRGALMINVK